MRCCLLTTPTVCEAAVTCSSCAVWDVCKGTAFDPVLGSESCTCSVLCGVSLWLASLTEGLGSLLPRARNSSEAVTTLWQRAVAMLLVAAAMISCVAPVDCHIHQLVTIGSSCLLTGSHACVCVLPAAVYIASCVVQRLWYRGTNNELVP